MIDEVPFDYVPDRRLGSSLQNEFFLDFWSISGSNTNCFLFLFLYCQGFNKFAAMQSHIVSSPRFMHPMLNGRTFVSGTIHSQSLSEISHTRFTSVHSQCNIAIFPTVQPNIRVPTLSSPKEFYTKMKLLMFFLEIIDWPNSVFHVMNTLQRHNFDINLILKELDWKWKLNFKLLFQAEQKSHVSLIVNFSFTSNARLCTLFDFT